MILSEKRNLCGKLFGTAEKFCKEKMFQKLFIWKQTGMMVYIVRL